MHLWRAKLRQNDCLRKSRLQDEMVPFRMRQLDPVYKANWQMVKFCSYSNLFIRRLTLIVHVVRYCPECAKGRSRRGSKTGPSEQKTYKNLIEQALRKLAKKKKGRAEVREMAQKRQSCLVCRRDHRFIGRALSEKSAP